MRKVLIGSVSVLIAAAICGCGGMWTMKDSDSKKSPIALNDKAVLVIARTTSYGFAVALDNYLDGKLIGQTKGKCYFITNIEPGEHLVTTKCENMRTHKINFEAGKIYYLQQTLYMGMWKARTEYDTLNPQIFEEQKPECDFLVFDADEAKGEDDAVLDMKEAQEERDKQMKDEAQYYRKIDGIKGY